MCPSHLRAAAPRRQGARKSRGQGHPCQGVADPHSPVHLIHGRHQQADEGRDHETKAEQKHLQGGEDFDQEDASKANCEGHPKICGEDSSLSLAPVHLHHGKGGQIVGHAHLHSHEHHVEDAHPHQDDEGRDPW